MLDSSSNVTITPSEFPSHAKALGADFLAYTLNTDRVTIDELMAKGGSLSAARHTALLELDALMLPIIRERFGDQVLHESDRVSLSQLISQSTATLFERIRAGLGAEQFDASAAGDDPVLATLMPLCLAAYPTLLLPRSAHEVAIGVSLHHPHFLATPELRSFCQAVLDDPDLSAIFPIKNDDLRMTRGSYYGPLGQGQSFQLGFLWLHFLNNAWALMNIRGECSPEHLPEALKTVLSVARAATSSTPSTTCCALLFEGVGLPADTTIETAHGTLMPIPDTLLTYLPSEAKPATRVGNELASMMLVFDLPYTVSVTTGDEPASGKDRWPKHTLFSLQQEQETEIALVTALTLGDALPVTVRYKATLGIDPFCTEPHRTWRPYPYQPPFPSTILTPDQISDFEAWDKVISAVLSDERKIELAIRRYLSAMTKRTSSEDSFIDAVIALENLFGGRTEIAFTIATCVARLLGKNTASRKEYFKAAKKIYNKRSSIVHGGDTLDDETMRR